MTRTCMAKRPHLLVQVPDLFDIKKLQGELRMSSTWTDTKSYTGYVSAIQLRIPFFEHPGQDSSGYSIDRYEEVLTQSVWAAPCEIVMKVRRSTKRRRMFNEALHVFTMPLSL